MSSENWNISIAEIMAYAAWHRNGPDKRVKIHRPVGVKLKEPDPVPVVPVPVEPVPVEPVPVVPEPDPVSVVPEPEPVPMVPEPEPEPRPVIPVVPVVVMAPVPRIQDTQRLSSIEVNGELQPTQKTYENEKLPYVHGKVVFLRVEQSKKKFQKVDDISSKITFDENLAICLSLSFS